MSTPSTTSRWAGAALASSALVLTGLILWQLGSLTGSNPARASSMLDLVASNADMTMLTADAGSDDVLVVLDQHGESLLVYHVVGQQRLDFVARQSLRELFMMARQAQGAPPVGETPPPSTPPAPGPTPR